MFISAQRFLNLEEAILAGKWPGFLRKYFETFLIAVDYNNRRLFNHCQRRRNVSSESARGLRCCALGGGLYDNFRF